MDLSVLSIAGFTLNPEERTTIQSSLAIKKTEENFADVQFCAKILGTKGDYYIAYGTGEDVFERKFFYWWV